MSGRRWTPDEMAAFRRLASGEAADVADLVRRFGAFTGRDLTRASADSLLRRLGISAREVVEAHARNVGRPAQSPTVRNTHESQPEVDIPAPEVVFAPPPPPVVPVGREMTVSLVGDVHAPEEDKPAWSACLRWHAEHRPDLVVLTEIGEWLSMTKHGGNWGASFEEDVRATRRKLVQVRSVCPDARIVLLEANHDTRMLRRIAEMMPQLVGRLAIPSELKLDDLGIEWVPQTVAFRVGRLKVLHGHQLASNAKGQVPENACKRAIQRFGEPGWTVVFFHTHRRGYWMERHDSGVLEAVNLPCLRTLAPDWTAPCPTGWSHGFGVAHVGPAGQTNLYTVDIERGGFVYGGKRYAA